MFDNFNLLASLAIATIGLLSAFVKFFGAQSRYNKKTELKTDLELFDQLINSKLDEEEIHKVKLRQKETLNDYLAIGPTSIKLFDTFYGLIVFLGFAWWTIFIINDSKGFNP